MSRVEARPQLVVDVALALRKCMLWHCSLLNDCAILSPSTWLPIYLPAIMLYHTTVQCIFLFCFVKCCS